MADNFELKPLSSGLGLGTLKPSKGKKSIYRASYQAAEGPLVKVSNDHADISPFNLHSHENNAHLSKPMTPSKHPQAASMRPVEKSSAAFLVEEIPLARNLENLGTSSMPSPSEKQQISINRGQAEYKAQSHSNVMKSSRSSKFLIWLAKALVGWGLDLFVVIFTVTISALLGSFAWRLGRGVENGSDPIAIVTQLLDLVVQLGPTMAVGTFLTAFVIYFIAMKSLVGTTIGGSLHD